MDKLRLVKRWPMLGVGTVLLVALLVSGAATVARAHGADNTHIHACVEEDEGDVEIVGPDEDCEEDETAIDLLTVGPDGNVGIGKTDPTEALDVDGNTRSSGKVLAGAFSSNSPLVFEAPAGTERARIDDITGNVGIGTTDPIAPLHIANGALFLEDAFGDIWFKEVADLSAYVAADSPPSPSDPVFRVFSPPFGEAGLLMSVIANGNVGIGTPSPAEKLQVVGDISADRVAYNAPRTHHFSVGDGAFFSARSSQPFETSFGAGGTFMTATGSGVLVAPVQLPDGAVVTGLKVFFVDDSGEDIIATLMLKSHTTIGFTFMASVDTSAATPSPSAQSLEDSTIISPTIDNVNNSYHVRAFSSNWPGTNALRISGAVVTYTIAEAD